MKIPQTPPKVHEVLQKEHPHLLKLLENKSVTEFIAKSNQEYPHWDQFRYKPMPNQAKPEQVWALLKLFRNGQYKKLQFGKWTFRYILLDVFQKKLHLLDTGTAGKLGLNLDSPNFSGREKYIISSLMEEAIASSQLEGAATTRRVAKELLRLKKKPRNFSEQMIVNGYQTIQKIVRLKEKKITPEIILELHKNITQDTLKDKAYEGQWRTNNEVVVGDQIEVEKIYHRPPNYKDIPELMKEFCEFASEDTGEFIHPIIKGVILHFLIGYIHPFEDGNGRTARTILYWYVLTRGYWLFEFMAISRIILRAKVKYGLAYLYTETDDNDLTYFIDYNLDCIEEALYDMEKYIQQKQQEQADALKWIKSLNVNLRQAEILKEFVKNPEKSFVVNEIINTYGVAYDTARNDLLYLTKLGYLEKVKVQKKYLFKLSQKKITGLNSGF